MLKLNLNNSWLPEINEAEFTNELKKDLIDHLPLEQRRERARTAGYYMADLLVSNGLKGNEVSFVIDAAIDRCDPPLPEDVINGIRSGVFQRARDHFPRVALPVYDIEIRDRA